MAKPQRPVVLDKLSSSVISLTCGNTWSHVNAPFYLFTTILPQYCGTACQHNISSYSTSDTTPFMILIATLYLEVCSPITSYYTFQS